MRMGGDSPSVMDITILDAEGLPDRAFLYIRVGECRRQSQYKAGEMFHFDNPHGRKHFSMDVFAKVGTRQVSLSELSSTEETGVVCDRIDVPRLDGSAKMSVNVKVAVGDSNLLAAGGLRSRKDKRSVFKDALKVKGYLDDHAVQKVLHNMVQSLLRVQPEDPYEFMSNYLLERRNTYPLSPQSTKASDKFNSPGDGLCSSTSPKDQQACPQNPISPPLRQLDFEAKEEEDLKANAQSALGVALIKEKKDEEEADSLKAKALNALGVALMGDRDAEDLKAKACSAQGVALMDDDEEEKACLKARARDALGAPPMADGGQDDELLKGKAQDAIGRALFGADDEPVDLIATKSVALEALSKALLDEEDEEEEEAGGHDRNFEELNERLVAFREIPGLDDAEPPGFPVDSCPEEPPDLSQHHSTMATVLKENTGIYTRLRSLSTCSGVSFAKCIKPGVDNKGHRMIRTVGAVAGDSECYTVFRDFFDPIILAHHAGYAAADDASRHPTELDSRQLSGGPMDASGQYIESCQLVARRNLTGIRLTPSINHEERVRVETALVKAAAALPDDMCGEYFPLRSSFTYPPRPGGMSVDEEASLEQDGLLFREPDAGLVLSSGIGRNWPEGRGIFASKSRSVAIMVNEEDHMKLVITREGDKLQEAFEDFCRAEAAVRERLQQDGLDYERTDRLGFVTTCPTFLGSTLRVSVLLRLPLLSEQGNFKAICQELGVQVRMSGVAEDTGEKLIRIVESGRLGMSEVALLNHVASSCRQLIAKEVALATGSPA
eukprot:gnl/TRDRNA2_/TRDRNA2_81478_c0_seq1.p1 gnl/TRDRNA2_/TRDRNA2_81478_c0~~gnl/TRDRNA2_/TRDRNA2_81478_c0_seq1.p1  ORF type:complete len:780 (-),score=164.96 gnl/TRDRNA2_/TRDRNA2_81478_c0_seq1:111-2450(-)